MGNYIRDLQIERVDAQTPYGIKNFNDCCRYATTEAFASNNISEISKQLTEIIKCNNEGLIERSNTIVGNLIQSFNNALEGKNYERMSQVSLIKSVDGVFVQDWPIEQKMELVAQVPMGKMREDTELQKKK